MTKVKGFILSVLHFTP